MDIKNLDIELLYDTFLSIIPELSPENQILISRFIDKLADSDKFAKTAHEVFYRLKIDRFNKSMILIDDSVEAGTIIQTSNRFFLKKTESAFDFLTLDENDQLIPFIRNIDSRLAKKIFIDVNVAYSIKSARLRRGLED